MKIPSLILAAAVVAATPAWAANSPATAAGKLPAEMVQGQVRFISGGVGKEQALAFRQAENRYPLALEFAVAAKPHDEFIANVHVVIRDAGGRTVLDTVAGGPFLLARLPEGKYVIKATQAGHSIEHHAEVAASGSRQVAFVWKEKAAAG